MPQLDIKEVREQIAADWATLRGERGDWREHKCDNFVRRVLTLENALDEIEHLRNRPRDEEGSR